MTQEQLRMQMLAGIITEGQYKAKLNEQEEIDTQAIKDEMKDFYDLMVSDDDVKDWLQSYHYDRIEDDPDYDGNFVFDTSEREDFYHYLID
jgi:hypothetical protein